MLNVIRNGKIKLRMFTHKDKFGVLYLINKGRVFSSRTRLQKLILIAKLDKEIQYPFSFDFEPYYYGPYSKQLSFYLDILVASGLVREDIVEKETVDAKIYHYSLTAKGKNFLNKSKGAPKEDFKKIDRLWGRFSGFDNDRVIRYAKDISGMESTKE